MEKLDRLKQAICSVVSGLELKQVDTLNWVIGGVCITHEEPTTHPAYIVSYGVVISGGRMEPDDVDIVDVASFRTLEAAIPCAIQVAIEGAIANVEDELAATAEAQRLCEEVTL